MVSAKGTPTDPKLKEKVTEEIKQQTNKDGSGKGQMAAWKAVKIGKEYEAKGGDYIDTPGSKNKAKKGTPEKKTAADDKPKATPEKKTATDDKPKANIGKKAGRPKGAGTGAPRKKKEPPREGTRKSARQAETEAGDGKTKRKAAAGDDEHEDKAAKKTKTAEKKK